MTVKQLYKILDAKIPKELSCEWDNDGLMLCPEPHRQVRKVLIALDATADVADAAIEGGFDVIVTHHPVIFKGLKAINDENYVSEKAIRLIRAGVAVFSFHTRLDALEGGVNDVLALELGLENIEPFGEEGIGRIGDLYDEQSVEEFAFRIKEWLDAPYVNLANANKECRRVAVLGGSGDDDVRAAIAAGADTYVSGELKYHTLADAPEMGINLIEAGHFYTEYPVLCVLEQLIEAADEAILCDIFYSNKIKAVI